MKINTRKDTLSSLKLKYEETEIKPMKAHKNRVKNVKQWLTRAIASINPVKHHRKTSKKSTKLEQEAAKRQRKNAILGIGLLLVVVSIAYSTSVIYIGVDSEMSRIALLPQAVFGLITIFKAFSKLYR